MSNKKQFNTKRLAAAAIALVCSVSALTGVVYAQNTYVITDGSKTETYTTFATDPAEVLAKAGITLADDDTYSIQETESGELEIRVLRNLEVFINNGGQEITTISTGETVGQLLDRMNISVDGQTEVSQDLGADVTEGMEISISRTTYEIETYTQAIPYEVEYVNDDVMVKGKEKVLTVGSDGEMKVSAQVTYVDGVEVSRSVISSVVTTAPVNQVVAQGTAQYDPNFGDLHIGDGIIVTADGDILTYTGSMQCLATAYSCNGTGGITATGTVARVGAIAVDPRVIPYGTRMFIVSNDGAYIYGVATAEDTGHPDHITGNRIDLYYNTTAECIQFGARNCTVYFLG